MLPEEVQAVNAAGRRMDIIAMPRQYGLQEVAIHAIVIDDKDFDHRQAFNEDRINSGRGTVASLPWHRHLEKQNRGTCEVTRMAGLRGRR
jgi:hypothetical protein